MSEIESRLAIRFAALLEEAEPGHLRISLSKYTAAFLAAEPSLTTAPERRARLSLALDELIAAHVVVPSRKLDRTENPPLPVFIKLTSRDRDPPVGLEAARYAWRPELSWASRVPLRRSEFDALRAVQKFIRDRGADAPIVPAGERSLELFDDEKRLDTLRRNRRLFAPGRLSIDLLRIRFYAPPFCFRRISSAPVALVLENVATYHSVLATLPSASPIGVVVFGAGGNFAASVGYFAELRDLEPNFVISEIRYFGDLDRRGLEIPRAANVAAKDLGLPSVRPAVGLYARLLRFGRRAQHPTVDRHVAEQLVSWLPKSLRNGATEVLEAGARMAQEAIGTEILGRDSQWADWASLGPPGLEHITSSIDHLSTRPVRPPEHSSMGDSSVVFDDEGRRVEPEVTGWADWINANDLRNWLADDPILDWLNLFGERNGFIRDDARPGYDERFNFHRFIGRKSVEFLAGVQRALALRAEVVTIASRSADAQSLEKAQLTLQALRAGTPIVANAVFRDPQRRKYGIVDLVVRSDLLATWFPELLVWEEATIAAPGLSSGGFHYRVVEVALRSLEVTSNGQLTASPGQIFHAAKALIASEALGRMQGYTPPTCYVLGRTWKHNEQQGDGCLERLASVDEDWSVPSREMTIENLIEAATDWIRRLRRDGDKWRLLPEPSVPELYPHARSDNDAPWHFAKAEIARALGELTLLPGMTPQRRRAAHQRGIRRWDDPRSSAENFDIDSPAARDRCNAVLRANSSPAADVFPSKITRADTKWRTIRPVEFYVDFETVNGLNDTFAKLPDVGAQPLIAVIGCGHYDAIGNWIFAQWIVRALDVEEEIRVLDAWLTHMHKIAAGRETTLDESQIVHWGSAERAHFESAVRRGRARDVVTSTVTLPWFDLLNNVVRAEPVAIKGAFDFKLKSIARAMDEAELIQVVWSNSSIDGDGVLAAICHAAVESRSSGTALGDHPLLASVAEYNAVDCRAVAEILRWLRANR